MPALRGSRPTATPCSPARLLVLRKRPPLPRTRGSPDQ
uniref:Uncharacterized protein n=1 Tax=Arundo donax TaxID=35708 RepID=A0A0A9GRX4_ARUDO